MSDAFKRLPCKLDDYEKADRAAQVARELRRRDELQAAKKEAAAEATSEIKALDKRIAELAEAANTGVEYRDVEVRDEVRGLRMETVRCDTWETVGSRPLDEDERQTALPHTHREPTTVHMTTMDGKRVRVGKRKEEPTDDEQNTH